MNDIQSAVQGPATYRPLSKPPPKRGLREKITLPLRPPVVGDDLVCMAVSHWGTLSTAWSSPLDEECHLPSVAGICKLKIEVIRLSQSRSRRCLCNRDQTEGAFVALSLSAAPSKWIIGHDQFHRGLRSTTTESWAHPTLAMTPCSSSLPKISVISRVLTTPFAVYMAVDWLASTSGYQLEGSSSRWAGNYTHQKATDWRHI